MKILLCFIYILLPTTLSAWGCWSNPKPVLLNCADSCGRIGITGDYLCWKAHEDGLAFSINGIISSGLIPPPSQGEAKNLNWKWDNGYRVGFYYTLPCHCWDFGVIFTRFHTRASGIYNQAETGVSLWETWGAPTGGTFVTDSRGDWKLRFQTVDIEGGYLFGVGKCFIFRPFGGIEFVRTRDTYDIFYANGAFFQDIHNKQHFCGWGPRIGIANNWNIFKCVSLFADGALSLIHGEFRVHRRDLVLAPQIGPTPTVVLNTGDRFSAIRTLLDFKVGVRLDACLCRKLHIFAKVAFENLLFLQHNQMMRFSDGTVVTPQNANYGNYWNIDTNLSFRGLTASFGASF